MGDYSPISIIKEQCMTENDDLNEYSGEVPKKELTLDEKIAILTKVIESAEAFKSKLDDARKRFLDANK